MRVRIINMLKTHPKILGVVWIVAGIAISIIGLFIRENDKQIMFASFGGRKYDDSPKAIYDEVCADEDFKDWRIVWAFVNPNEYDVRRGEKVKIDTPTFFAELMKSKVWVSNSGMCRGIRVNRPNTIKVETWHGTPLKKIGGEENQNSLESGRKKSRKIDNSTIRCAQSEYDREIFMRLFNCDRKSVFLCDLPRNDKLSKYTNEEVRNIKKILDIPKDKKVILYTPTYREYALDSQNNTYFAPPIDLGKWESTLGNEYVLLFRAHYAVIKSMKIHNSEFVKDVSDYDTLNDLYLIADLMISDYSSTFIDYSILERPMLCFAYDLDEYIEKRGLYISLDGTLPCRINKNEDELLEEIKGLDYAEASLQCKGFHERFAPYSGNASEFIVNEIKHRI